MSDQTGGTGAPDLVDEGAPPQQPSVQTLDTDGNLVEGANEEGKGSPVVSVAPGDTHADEPYLGTDPIYQNHAADTDEPLVAEEPSDPNDPNDQSLVEERAQEAAEAAVEAGQHLGRAGFTVDGPGSGQPPKTVEEVDAYNAEKASRMQAIREESARHDPRAIRTAAIDERVAGGA